MDAGEGDPGIADAADPGIESARSRQRRQQQSLILAAGLFVTEREGRCVGRGVEELRQLASDNRGAVARLQERDGFELEALFRHVDDEREYAFRVCGEVVVECGNAFRRAFEGAITAHAATSPGVAGKLVGGEVENAAFGHQVLILLMTS